MDEVFGTGQLPTGWAWARLDELCDVIGGITVDAKRRTPDAIEVPYLRVANVQRGHLDLTKMRTIEVSRDRLDHLRLKSGDILLNEGGDRDKVGRGWVWDGALNDCIFQNHVFRARPRSPDLNSYLLSHFLNEGARPYFLAGAKQTTNLASISLSKVAATPIPVPPMAEQARIMLFVEALFIDLDEAEAALSRAQEQVIDDRAIRWLVQTSSGNLRRSIVYAAFTGRLVPQDTTDEPAAVFLGQLHTARSQCRPTRGRKGGSKTLKILAQDERPLH